MANEEVGTSSAPVKAAGKSENVSGAQVELMLRKREAAATTQAAESSADTPKVEAPKDAETGKTTQTPEQTVETKETSQPAKGKEAEAKGGKPETETATDPDEVLSQQLSPELQRSIDKRIGKEVAKRKELEAENARLRAQANIQPIPANAESLKVQPTAENPLADIVDQQALLKAQQDAKETKRWAQEMLDRDDIDKGVTVSGVTYTKVQLKAVVRNAERMVEDIIPQRAQYIQQRSQADRQTAETFGSEPWMQDRTSEGFALYQQILREPDIAKRPNATWIAAIQVQGLIDVQRRQRANGKPAETAAKPQTRQQAPASQTGGSGGSAPSREPGETRAVKELQVAMEKMKAKHGVTGRDAEAYLRLQEQARSTR